MSIKGYKIVYDEVSSLGIEKMEVQAYDLPSFVRKAIDQYFDSIEEGEDRLSDEEESKLKERLRDIEIEQRHAWGLHRISGGFVSADYDYVDDDKIYITLTDGIQSDCQNTTNVTHCSLWRDSLEWTD